jgi:thiamine biosynthesis lipoprotein
MTRAALLLAACAVLVAACTREPEPLRERLLVFGSEAELSIAGVPPAQARRAITEVAARMAERNREWHAWEASDLTRINAAFAAGEPVVAPVSVRELIRVSQDLSLRSGGAFDPAIGGLIALWGFHTSDYPIRSAPPQPAQIAAWRAHQPRIGEVSVRSDDTVYSTNPAVQLDFGAIAEGAAASEIAELLAHHGIGDALITLGGDVLALGRNHSHAWRVAITDPRGGILAGVSLAPGEALFTSGDYSKYRILADGSRLPHILDPRSGEPARGAATAVVLSTDPLLADVAATALMVAGPDGFEAMVRRLGLGCALLLGDDDTLRSTRAMRVRIELLRTPARELAPLDLGAGCAANTTAR